MKQTRFRAPIHGNKPRLLLLLFCVFFISYNGQVKTQVQHEASDSIQKKPQRAINEARIKKTQGSSKHANIQCSLQDKDGNLWFGSTGEGVYRFDGSLFTQYTINEGLNSNLVYSMLEDKAGYIWLGTENGVCRFDGKSFTPMSIELDMTDTFKPGTSVIKSAIVIHEVWEIMQDRSGTIWFGTSEGLFCFDGSTFTRFIDDPSIINKNNLKLTWVQCMLEDKNGTLWFGSGPIANEGLIRLDGKTLSNSKPNGDGWIRYILEDKKGIIWFCGRHNGIFQYNGKRYSRFTSKEGHITNGSGTILEDRNGNIWFGGDEKLGTVETNTGIWCYHPTEANGTGDIAFKIYSTKDGLGIYSVWSMLEDTEGNIWIGTRNTGLYKFDGRLFTNYNE